MVRGAALSALGVAFRSGLTSAQDRVVVHQAVARAATDPYLDIKLKAIRWLGTLSDTADLPLLRRIEAEDTTQTKRGDQVFYPARAFARIAIAGIRAP